jgi:cortexillin 1/2
MKLNDLSSDFRDGVLLANFLELLTRKKMQFTKKPSLKIQSIENLSICLKCITGDCGVRLVGIGAEGALGAATRESVTLFSQLDVHEGNVKLILGMLWSLFRRFKIQTISEADKSSEEGLLLWVKGMTVRRLTRAVVTGFCACVLARVRCSEITMA